VPVFVHPARDKVGAGLSARINALGMIVAIDGSASMVCTRRWCALTRQMPSLISRGNCVVLVVVFWPGELRVFSHRHVHPGGML
jgi:hypothetical protein